MPWRSSKVVVNAVKPPSSSNARRPSLDGGGIAQRLVAGSAFFQLGSDAVFLLIDGAELVDLGLGGGVDFRDEIADAEGVHFPAEADLGGNLVAFRDGNVAHVVADAGDLEVARGVPAAGGAGPGGEALVDFRVLPVADDDLARQAQARADVPELAAAVGGLVQVHEIHVDRRPTGGRG